MGERGRDVEREGGREGERGGEITASKEGGIRQGKNPLALSHFRFKNVIVV